MAAQIGEEGVGWLDLGYPAACIYGKENIPAVGIMMKANVFMYLNHHEESSPEP